MGKFSWLLIYFCGCRVGFDLSMCFTLRRKNKRARSAWPAPPRQATPNILFYSLLYVSILPWCGLARCLSPIDSIGPKSWEGAAEFSHTFCRFLRVHLTRRTARDELVARLQQARSPAPIRHGKTISPLCPFATHQLTQPTTYTVKNKMFNK
jgi:hypothetical protein